MSNTTVQHFYDKDSYQESYDSQHGPRLDAMIERFGLGSLRDQRILDVGGGLGFLGKRLDRSNDYWVVDGASITPEQQLCPGWRQVTDLDHEEFSLPVLRRAQRDHVHEDRRFDVAFCLETLEHLSNPYHCLVEIKKLVKPGGLIYLSVPSEVVWHNVVYPGLLWPRQNFEQFLGQMALPGEFWHYTPKDRGWPAYHWKCVNLGWDQKRLAFPKDEEKFRMATPLECTNL